MTIQAIRANFTRGRQCQQFTPMAILCIRDWWQVGDARPYHKRQLPQH